ncbi:OstA-like protein [Aurantibacter sp.]|uniref:OstA-like protein n=1 Tax=Aurantibacter sp. TaxID=2807103 RepID=UPI0035C82F36
MKHLKSTYLLLFLFGLITQIAFTQNKTIEIKEAGFGDKDEKNHPGASILTRNNQAQVHIYHEGIDMYCDKAIFYGKEDFIEAYGNVVMKQGDTINLTAKYAEYSGKTKLAFASGDVLLTEPSSTLTTDTLYFNREAQQAYYKSGGRVVRDSSGVITSTVGRFYMKEKKYRFLNTVKLVNPEYILTTNQLDFYTETGHAYMYGPSDIVGETSEIYSERGFYDTNNDTGYFEKNAKIDYDNREVKGDSLYFDRSKNFASATNNITVTDTINNSIIKGHYAEVYRAKDSVFITKRALAITIQENDSIYIHADTLMVTGKADKRITRAFKNAKIYKSDLSGKADSLHVNHQKGLTELININKGKIDAFSKTRKPVLWHLKNQMTGDTIHIISNPETEKIDSLKVFKNAFMISKDSIDVNGYNQISGQRLIGLFNDKNEIYQVDILKNAESIYYARNEEDDLIGIERSKSANISIFFESQDVVELRKLQQVDGTLFKEEEINAKERILKGFNWREEERPKNVEDLFSEDLPLNLPKIKGIEEALPEEEFFDEKLINRMIDADKIAEDKNLTKKDKLPKSSRNLPKKFISKNKKGKRKLVAKPILEVAPKK